MFVNGLPSLYKQLASQIVQPCKVVYFSDSLHIMCCSDSAIYWTLGVQSINFRVNQVIRSLFVQARLAMDAQLVLTLLRLIKYFSFVRSLNFVTVCVENWAFPRKVFNQSREYCLLQY